MANPRHIDDFLPFNRSKADISDQKAPSKTRFWERRAKNGHARCLKKLMRFCGGGSVAPTTTHLEQRKAKKPPWPAMPASV
jgi:hypothetical protein